MVDIQEGHQWMSDMKLLVTFANWNCGEWLCCGPFVLLVATLSCLFDPYPHRSPIHYLILNLLQCPRQLPGDLSASSSVWPVWASTFKGIRKQNQEAWLKAFEADLSLLSSIMELKFSLEQWLNENDLHSSIQLLINNAGILAVSSRRTADGLDEILATNYVGAFCLTKLLLPLLTCSPVPSCIVNVTSFTHRNVCLLLFTYKLHQQFSSTEDPCQLSAVAADPEVVKTNIMRELPRLFLVACFVLSLLRLLHCPDDGVQSILDAALTPMVTPLYFGEYLPHMKFVIS